MSTLRHRPELLPANAAPIPLQAWYRYGVAIVLVLAGTVLRLTLLQSLGARAAFLTFYPAVIVAALYGGLGPGLVATILSGCVANFFLMEPAGSLAIKQASDFLSLLVFLLSGATISWITGAMRRAQARATRAESEAKLAAEREQVDRRLNRTLKALGRSNEAILRATQEKQYLEEVCKIIVQDCGHAMVWIGFAEQDEIKSVRPVVHAGFEQGYIDSLKITWADTERGRGPTGTAIRTGKPAACRHMLTDPAFSPWREQAIKQGYASSLATPLLADGKALGAITLYSRESNAFSEEEQEVLVQLADDVAIALAKFRAEEALRLAQAQLKAYAQDLEKTVASRTAKLQETIGELEHFSYAIVHDMRAPLRAMHSFAEMLVESCGKCENTASQEFFRRIRVASNRMDRLITDSLNYSKAIRQELALEPVGLCPLLDGLVETYPNLQPDKADIRIAHDLPTVLANHAALTQCFSNLLDNAAKFCKAGAKPQIRIWAEPSSNSSNSASTRSPHGFVRIWVEDDGIGIPKNAQQRIFSLFQRATNDHDGTGIGLAIVDKVVQRMGGKVGVESEPGKGSRFWVELAKAP